MPSGFAKPNQVANTSSIFKGAPHGRRHFIRRFFGRPRLPHALFAAGAAYDPMRKWCRSTAICGVTADPAPAATTCYLVTAPVRHAKRCGRRQSGLEFTAREHRTFQKGRPTLAPHGRDDRDAKPKSYGRFIGNTTRSGAPEPTGCARAVLFQNGKDT